MHHCCSGKMRPQTIYFLQQFPQIKHTGGGNENIWGWGVTRSTPFLSKNWGKLNWFENPLVSILLCKGLKEKFKLFEILHIFVWVLSDEIVFQDFTTFWCFSYLLEQIRPDVRGMKRKYGKKLSDTTLRAFLGWDGGNRIKIKQFVFINVGI